MQAPNQVRVVLFSGGRGTRTIATSLAAHPQVSLTVLVNAYDDGLSTGRLRAFLPGMLGPSDLRKNIATLMPTGERCQLALKRLLELRLPAGASREQALETLASISRGGEGAALEAVSEACAELSVRQVRVLERYCQAFMAREEREHAAGRSFDYADCALGNLLFAGCYLGCGEDFNRAVAELAGFCEVQETILNITDGTNLVLCGVDSGGSLLVDEASIVEPRQGASIREVFLLDDYLSPDDQRALGEVGPEEALAFLRERSRTPGACPEALRALASADLIVYGAGTQHSSLLPSYLTRDVAEAIAENERAKKAFVGNIVHDHDIRGRGVQDLLRGFTYYMNRRADLDFGLGRYVSHAFLQRPDRSDANRGEGGSYVPFDPEGPVAELDLAVTQVHLADWEDDAGRHMGGQMADELLALLQPSATFEVRRPRYMISIVVPVLDEAPTLGTTLSGLSRLDLGRLGVDKEIVVVDGGSEDGSVAIARQHADVRSYTLPRGAGRGEVLRFGVEKAKGNVVVFFPSDGEYSPEDVLTVAEPIVKDQFQLVFGSRAIKCFDLTDRIRHIYGDDGLGYLMSKYGGMLTSFLCVMLYNRYVADPYSTLKAFDRAAFEELGLQAKGMELETEVIAKASLSRRFILEVPVRYSPRTRGQGKKTTLGGGLRAIAELFQLKLRRPLFPHRDRWRDGA